MSYIFRILEFDCDPNWTDTTKNFAVIEDNMTLTIWNINDEKRVSGHKAHDNYKDNSPVGMCYGTNGQIFSIVDGRCIKYCIKSNTYIKYQLHEKYSVCIMKVSPYDENIIAAGTKRGLVIILDANGKYLIVKFDIKH